MNQTNLQYSKTRKLIHDFKSILRRLQRLIKLILINIIIYIIDNIYKGNTYLQITMIFINDNN